MRVRITGPACGDLTAIGDRIAEEAGKNRARLFVLDLRERCLGLERMPERFALLSGFEDRGVRRRVCGNYLIVYRVKDGAVEILRILHGARDYERLLDEDPRLN